MNINHEEINRRIGRAIAQYRQQSGLTQEQVAEKLPNCWPKAARASSTRRTMCTPSSLVWRKMIAS